MPIYGYRCNDCGFKKDHLQKLGDTPIAACPSCGGHNYAKQLSAAGFQLKGSGWYATDFKGSGSQSAGAAKSEAGSTGETKTSDSNTSKSSNDDGGSTAAGSCGTGCACH